MPVNLPDSTSLLYFKLKYSERRMATFLTETTIENQINVDVSSVESNPTPSVSPSEPVVSLDSTPRMLATLTPRPPPTRTPRLETKRSFISRSLRSSSGIIQTSSLTKSVDPESERDKRAAELMSEWLSAMPPTMPFHRGQVTDTLLFGIRCYVKLSMHYRF